MMTKRPAKKGQKWKDRISGTTSVVNLIYITLAGIIAAATIAFAVSHYLFPTPQPPAQLTAQIQNVTVQQDVTWKFYLAESGDDVSGMPSPPPPATPGILVQIAAKLSGYELHSYSGDVTLLNPKTGVELTPNLVSFNGICSEVVPMAAQVSFVLQCWIGEPKIHQSFLVRSRLYHTGLGVTNGPTHYVPVHPEFLAVLDTGVFASTG